MDGGQVAGHLTGFLRLMRAIHPLFLSPCPFQRQVIEMWIVLHTTQI
jgi:hypothetical protein